MQLRIQHRWIRPALALARQASTRFTYPEWMESWVDLGSLLYRSIERVRRDLPIYVLPLELTVATRPDTLPLRAKLRVLYQSAAAQIAESRTDSGAEYSWMAHVSRRCRQPERYICRLAGQVGTALRQGCPVQSLAGLLLLIPSSTGFASRQKMTASLQKYRIEIRNIRLFRTSQAPNFARYPKGRYN